MNRSMSIIINTVDSCNLNCAYCYAPKVTPDKMQVVSDDTIIKLIEGSAQLGIKNVQFVWHGNEPTLAGIDFFQRMLELQCLHGQPGQNFANVMQSNGTLIDDDWLSFFVEKNIGVGISLDGPAFLHDLNRRRIGGGSTHRAVSRNWSKLRNSNCDGGICSVITTDSLDKATEMVSYFANLQVPELDFLPCFPVENVISSTDKYISPEEYGIFLIQAFDKWLELDDPDFQIRTFENIILMLLGRESGYCKFRSDKCQDFLGVDVQGDVYPCDLFVGYEEWKLGSLTTDDLWTIITGERSRKYLHAMQQVDDVCKQCKWLKICWGGCSFHRFLVDKNLQERTLYCESRKMLFEHISKTLELIPPETTPKYLKPHDYKVLNLQEDVYLDLGHSCNSSCYFCAADSSLNMEPIWNLIDKQSLQLLTQKGHNHLIVTGGEATVHSELFDLLDYAKQIGFKKIHLQTNGRRLSNQRYLKRLIDSGVDEFGMSLHGHTASIHDFVTASSGSFSQTIRAIENLNFLYGANPPLAVNCVILPENMKYLSNLVEFLMSLNVSTIKLSYLHGIGKAQPLLRRDFWPSKTQIQPYIFEALQTAEALGKSNTTLTIEAYPFCLLNGYENYSSDLNITPVLILNGSGSFEVYHSGMDRGKSSKCKGCDFETLCLGPWKEYPEEFGWSEFVPIKKGKIDQ